MATDATVRKADAAPDTERHPIRWQTAIIRRVVPRTSRLKSFFFELPKPLAFLAGQHVDVRLTAADGYQAQRSYSIASAPDMPGMLELAIEKLDDGEVSPFFHDVAAVGDTIELRGPFGGFFIWSAEDRGPVLLAGGGSGVVPLLSMARHRAALRSRTPMVLLLSARTWEDTPYRDELIDLASRRDGFELVFTLTRDTTPRASDDSLTIHRRRLDAAIATSTLAQLGGFASRAYLCGSNPFCEAAAQSFLAASVPERAIRIERYGGS
jgi:ferredoxin-NADP reductase